MVILDSQLDKSQIAQPLNLDGPVYYQEIQARSVLNRVKAMMPMAWTINPYRGCRHACVYCYARPSHTYYGLNAGADFHTQIFVKINAAAVLRQELARPSWKHESICLGSATDPYQPAERRYRLTRQILQVLCNFANPVEIITKSHLVVDDLDILSELNRRTQGRVAVNMSLTTLDEAKARQIDPGAPSPRKRLEALAKLTAAGIKTRLFIMPILPGITDNPVELEELVKAAAETGVRTIAADTLRIARGLEDYFDDFLDKYYPELHPRYERLYSGGRRTLVVDAYKEALKKKVNEWRIKYGMTETRPTPEEVQAEFERQASLGHYMAEVSEMNQGNNEENTSAIESKAKTARKTLFLSPSLPEQTSFEF